jgi:kinesin family protein 3/17
VIPSIIVLSPLPPPGTGKTFTMEGSLSDPELHGIMPNTFTHIFEAVSGAAANTQFLVKASFIEIYLDDVYDLLSTAGTRTKMELKRDPERGVYVKDVNTQVAKNPEDLFRILTEGQKQRRVGATDMNKGSSRSHSIFSVVVETSTENADGSQSYRQGT